MQTAGNGQPYLYANGRQTASRTAGDRFSARRGAVELGEERCEQPHKQTNKQTNKQIKGRVG
jgi:hypothetical protein